MGSFWIFLLFAGIVALSKRNEAAPKDSSSQELPTTGAPSETEKQDIERRIREILSEPQPAGRVEPTVTPTERRVATPTVQPARSVTIPARPQPQHYSLESLVSRGHNVSAISLETIEDEWKQPKPSKSHKPKQAKTTKPKDEPRANSELQAIIDDFTMEKAVIYAEILEPKFKEY